MFRWAAVLSLALVACGPSRRAWQPRRDAADALGPAAYAVVPAGTELSIAPRDGAPRVWGIMRPYAAFRVRGQENGWTELENLPAGGPHCTPSIPRLEPFRLRFFVPERALARVTHREITQTFPDGTRIELARGVPLEPLPGTSLFRAHMGDVVTIVELGHGDVGTRYLPSTGFEPSYGARGYVSRDALTAGVAIVGQTGRVEALRATDVPVVAIEDRGSEVLAQIRPTCARLTVRVPAHAIGEPGGLMGDLTSESPQPYLLPAGTVVYWRDGTEAGVVVSDVRFATETEPVGDRRCFSHVLAFEPARIAIDLCAARGDTTGTAEPPSRALDAPR